MVRPATNLEQHFRCQLRAFGAGANPQSNFPVAAPGDAADAFRREQRPPAHREVS
jgi:hypothetical protein